MWFADDPGAQAYRGSVLFPLHPRTGSSASGDATNEVCTRLAMSPVPGNRVCETHSRSSAYTEVPGETRAQRMMTSRIRRSVLQSGCRTPCLWWVGGCGIAAPRVLVILPNVGIGRSTKKEDFVRCLSYLTRCNYCTTGMGS